MAWADCYNCEPNSIQTFSLPSFTSIGNSPLNATLLFGHYVQELAVLGDLFIIISETEQDHQLYLYAKHVASGYVYQIATGLSALPLAFFTPNYILSGEFSDGNPPSYKASLYQFSNVSVVSLSSFQIQDDGFNQGYLTDSSSAICSWLNSNTLALLSI